MINEDSAIYHGKSTIAVEDEEEVFSSRRHLMDYVTADGIIKRTGYTDKKDWYLLVIKELFDNAIDWLWNGYKGAEGAKITAEITIDKNTNLFNCTIRNTNPKNIPVFYRLQHIFNYEMTYGSKQNEFKISRGTLGDAMKYIAALPYVLVNLGRDKSHDFSDLQWEIPMYIRHNGIEQELLLVVDEANSTIDAHITPVDQARPISHTDTEIEVTYPIIDEVKQFTYYAGEGTSEREPLDINSIAFYCKQQKVGTTDIAFDIRIVEHDNLNEDKPTKEQIITQATAHTISANWSNMPSVKAYTPKEIRKKMFGVHDKTSTTVFRILQTFKEGTQLKKRPDLEIPISELAKDPAKIKTLYYELRKEKEKIQEL